MRRKHLLLAGIALPCALAVGCTASDHEYVRNHIVLLQNQEAHPRQTDLRPAKRLEPGEAFGPRQSPAAF